MAVESKKFREVMGLCFISQSTRLLHVQALNLTAKSYKKTLQRKDTLSLTGSSEVFCGDDCNFPSCFVFGPSVSDSLQCWPIIPNQYGRVIDRTPTHQLHHFPPPTLLTRMTCSLQSYKQRFKSLHLRILLCLYSQNIISWHVTYLQK